MGVGLEIYGWLRVRREDKRFESDEHEVDRSGSQLRRADDYWLLRDPLGDSDDDCNRDQEHRARDINKPTPTDELYAQTQQRSISANFPDTEKFLEAYIDRFIDAVHDDVPTYHVYLTMVRTTEALYKTENLNNPLPPLIAANTIEEGRYGPRTRPMFMVPPQFEMHLLATGRSSVQ